MEANWRWEGYGDRGLVQVYDSTNGKIINEFKTRLAVSWLAFSPDGSMLAIPKGYTTLKVDLVDPTSGELIKSIDTGNHYVAEVAFSSDGSRLLTAGLDTRVNLWEVATGELLKSFSEHQYSINGLCWLHDGTGFISSDLAGYIHVTDIEPSEDDTILQEGEPALAISIRNSDGLIAAGNGMKVNIYNSDEELLQSFDTHERRHVQELSFSPDGRLLATANNLGDVAFFDPDSGEMVRECKGHTQQVRAMAFTPDGTKLVTGDYGGKVLVWDVATGKQIWSLDGHKNYVYAVACSPDGKLIASSDWNELLILWDAETGEQVHSIEYQKRKSEVKTDRRYKSMTFSPDSRHLVAGTQTSEIYYFDCETGLEVDRFFCNTRSIDAITFSPDGSRLVIGSNDFTVRIRDPKTHEELRVLTGHTNDVYSLSFNRSGTKLYSSSRDGTVRIWDATPSLR